jgi:hypothetical protein
VKNSFEPLLALTAALLVACCHGAPDAVHRSDSRDSPLRCAACHEPEFMGTTRPPHAGARPETCGVCHTQSSWGGARIEHPWWQLTGAHTRAAADRELAGAENRVKCFWCHRGEPAQFAGTSKECIGCHAEDRQGVKFPGHDTFASTCESCHSTEAWKPATHPVVTFTPVSAAPPPPSATAKPPRVPAPHVSPAQVPTQVPRPPPVSVKVPDITSAASRRH